MPNGNIHNIAGGFCGVLTYVMLQNNSNLKEEVKIEEIIFALCTGVGTARIPDMLEPPIHPNHRAFFHSLVFGGITGFVGVRAWKDLQFRRQERISLGKQQWSFNEFVDIAIIIASGSVLLHLIMDGFTPKGLTVV